MNLDFLKNKIIMSVIIAIVIVIGVYISNKNKEDESESNKSSGYYFMVLVVSFGVIYGVIYLYDTFFPNGSKSFLKGGSKNIKIENNSDTIFCDNPKW